MAPAISLAPCSVGLLGLGHCVGSEQYSNEQLLTQHNIRLKPSFLQRNIGIRSRYFLSKSQATSDMATEAGRQALLTAGLAVNDIDRLIVATSTPDYLSPSTACIVQHKLGGKGFPAFDIGAACSGFVYALDQAIRCILTGDNHVLVIGADARSRTLNMQDKKTAYLYGDGAGAVVVGRLTAAHERLGFIHSVLYADGAGYNAVYVPAGGSKEPCTSESIEQKRHKLHMPNGKRVADNAVSGIAELCQRVTTEAQLTLDDVGFFIFHQPNLRLLEKVLDNLNIDKAKTYLNFSSYGNTVAGSVPLVLSECYQQGLIATGRLVLICAVGAGFTGGAQLLRWNL